MLVSFRSFFLLLLHILYLPVGCCCGCCCCSCEFVEFRGLTLEHMENIMASGWLTAWLAGSVGWWCCLCCCISLKGFRLFVCSILIFLLCVIVVVVVFFVRVSIYFFFFGIKLMRFFSSSFGLNYFQCVILSFAFYP